MHTIISILSQSIITIICIILTIVSSISLHLTVITTSISNVILIIVLLLAASPFWLKPCRGEPSKVRRANQAFLGQPEMPPKTPLK